MIEYQNNYGPKPWAYIQPDKTGAEHRNIYKYVGHNVTCDDRDNPSEEHPAKMPELYCKRRKPDFSRLRQIAAASNKRHKYERDWYQEVHPGVNADGDAQHTADGRAER